ncbi:MAG: penicillin-binding transpeptidase domain-containing protein [Crocinitomicaceae bacterium]|nr:penicillin-binding transpeptidase domain-containing protein [Crocinitomicaceae bacterium]MDP4866692.1 penicillin-binding transpeptidase domain-containing protein [Crocinitomicaceae bacterium]
MNLDTRKYVIIAFFLIVGVIYATRLFYMQVIDDSWTLRAQQIAEKRREITPPRGVVFDRDGRKIISNSTYYNLMMIEKNIKNFDTLKFAKLIGWTPEMVRERFKEIVEGEGMYFNRHTGKKQSNYQKIRPYPFLKELTLEEVANIAPHLENFPGFYEEVTSMRRYPYANGANILGYLSEVNREEVDKDAFYSPGNNIGRAGIERFYEEQLRGQKGIKYIVTSALNNAIESYGDGKYDTLAVQGPALKLGVDIILQAYGEKLLQNKRGCIVAIEPSSGEILALVSAPTYDPNLLIGKRNISENYPALVIDPSKPLYPRPLAAEYPPGSTFKLLNSLIGLQEGVISPEFGVVCDKSVVGCHNHASASNLADAIKHSCNPYFYAVTRRIIQQGKKRSNFEDAEIGLNIWADYMHSFGLGKRLETDITGIRPGLIPDAKYYDKWYGHHRWAFSTIRSISIGQGEVMLTPLQMANIAAIIANRGWHYTPHFVKSIGDKGPLEQFRTKHYSKVDGRHYETIVEGMRRVVHEPGGTGKRARLKDIVVCGKTGTVQNPHGEDHSVFVAFAPMNKPKIAIAVFIENAKGGGGLWAAPTAGLMIEKYLTGKITEIDREKSILEANFAYK